LSCAALLPWFCATSGAEQSSGPASLEVRLSAKLERVIESREPDDSVRFDLVPATLEAYSGQFVYTVQFRNDGHEVADGVRITSPIPPELRYEPDSAIGPGSVVLFSVDGGRTFGAPAELVVSGVAGARRAEPADYTHVRWVLDAPLEIGARGFVRFRAVSR
jgi:uncharacterized repeat protein (TIGR01451 family)